jgi:hypothetical protein
VFALTFAIAAPVLRRGYVLSYDMVAVPRQTLLPDALGMGEALPRAVPAEAVVVALSHMVEGEWIQKTLLVVLLLVAGLGAAALVPSDRRWIKAVAATGYLWNAYVAERLVLGHWWLLLGYACLPWLVSWTIRAARGEPRALPALILVAAGGSMVPTAGLLSTVVVAVVLIGSLDWRKRGEAARRMGLVVGLLVVIQATWWLPGLLHPGASGGANPFAARADSAGVLFSVLTLGGVWNADVVPDSRTAPVVILGAALVLLAAGYGWRPFRERLGERLAASILALGARGLLLALWTTTTWGAAALDGAGHLFGGAGLLRDAQKFVVLWALPVVILVALATERLADRVLDPAGARAVLVGSLMLPLVVLPALGWGVAGRLQPVALPTSWSHARETIAQSAVPGDVLVLPWGSFRAFNFNGSRTSLDPAPRWLPRPSVVDGRLVVADAEGSGSMTVVEEESPRAGAAGALVAANMPAAPQLAALGIGWVVVERDTPGYVPSRLLVGLTPVLDADDLQLWRVPRATHGSGWGRGTTLVVLVDLAVVMLLVSAAVWLIGSGRRWHLLRSPNDS